MLSPSTKEKLKKLEIELEISLVDELQTKIIVEKVLDKTLEMHTEGIIDSAEGYHIFSILRSIIQEEETVAKMFLGNCVKMLDEVNKTAKTIELLGK